MHSINFRLEIQFGLINTSHVYMKNLDLIWLHVCETEYIPVLQDFKNASPKSCCI